MQEARFITPTSVMPRLVKPAPGSFTARVGYASDLKEVVGKAGRGCGGDAVNRRGNLAAALQSSPDRAGAGSPTEAGWTLEFFVARERDSLPAVMAIDQISAASCGRVGRRARIIGGR